MEDNKKLRELMGYVLNCYNEKKFDNINCIATYFNANDILADKSTLSDGFKKFIPSDNQYDTDKSTIPSREPTTKGEKILFFESKNDKGRCCSMKDILMNDNQVLNGGSMSKKSSSKNMVPMSKENKMRSYTNMHLNLTQHPTNSNKTLSTRIMSQSQRASCSDLLVSAKKPSKQSTQNGIQHNGYESDNENSENLNDNFEKFLITTKLSQKNKIPQENTNRNNNTSSKIISNDLEKLMHQKINEFK